MADRRSVDDLSIEELEHILILRRRQERVERMRRLGKKATGAGSFAASLKHMEQEGEDAREDSPQAGDGAAEFPSAGPTEPKAQFVSRRKPGKRGWRDSVLLILEVAALAGLVVVLLLSYLNLQTLNKEVAMARESTATPAASEAPQITLSVLPGGHSPPTAGNPLPQRLADLVQPVVPAPIPTPGPQSPTRIVIESIGVDAPVVPGDDWEQLKKGAGHHLNSANPGERGNTVISAHNDIFGEIFRHLDQAELEDEVIVYAGETPFRYIVKAKRIVEPSTVEVMAPTASPVLTLITCYPYMINTHRMVIIAELAD